MRDDLRPALLGALPAALSAGVATLLGLSAPGVAAVTGLVGVIWALGVIARRQDTEAQLAHVRSSAPQDTSRSWLMPDVTLVETMPTALLLVGTRGTITYANAAARALNPRFVPGVHYATLFRAPAFVDAVASAIRDQAAHHVVFSIVGQDRHMEASVAPLSAERMEDGSPVSIVLIDRTKDHRADQMRSDFIANASHELRTPLASILGYIETLQGHAREDPAAREQFFGIMAKQARRMQRLVDDLMNLSRIEMNEHIRPEGHCDLAQIAREAVSGLRPLAEDCGGDIVEEPLSPMVVSGDRDQLLQVLTNLIENGLKYGGDHPVVTVGPARPDPRYPGMIGICVSDTGPGIAREHLHRLTERFYRVNAAHSRNKGGTGLGLAIVKHILNRHGGALAIESNLGEGAQFSAYLRAVEKGDSAAS